MPTEPDRAPDVDDLAYADAVAELEEILDQLESDDVDVDVLADRVARAADLIRLCRGRLAGARVEVDRIVADLGALDDAAADDDAVDDDEDEGRGDEPAGDGDGGLPIGGR